MPLDRAPQSFSRFSRHRHTAVAAAAPSTSSTLSQTTTPRTGLPSGETRSHAVLSSRAWPLALGAGGASASSGGTSALGPP